MTTKLGGSTSKYSSDEKKVNKQARNIIAHAAIDIIDVIGALVDIIKMMRLRFAEKQGSSHFSFLKNKNRQTNKQSEKPTRSSSRDICRHGIWNILTLKWPRGGGS